MDQQKHSVTLTQQSVPAQIWVGTPDTLLAEIITYLQQQLCQHNGCATCTTCRHIAEQQHHAITWLQPEKNYTVDQLKIIFNTIAFALEPGQLHFFVLQKAECLTTVCANSLLKSLEEPPAGYHFLLLTNQPKQLLPTITSRCITKKVRSDHEEQQHTKIIQFFTTALTVDPLAFTKELDAAQLNERTSVELLDAILKFWLEQQKKAVIKNDIKKEQHATTMVTCLKHAYKKTPMPGSAKLFWKNLLLQMHG